MVHKKHKRFLLMSLSCSLNQSIEYWGLPRQARKAHLRGAETWAFLMEASSVSEHHFLRLFFIYFLRGHDINTYINTRKPENCGFSGFHNRVLTMLSISQHSPWTRWPLSPCCTWGCHFSRLAWELWTFLAPRKKDDTLPLSPTKIKAHIGFVDSSPYRAPYLFIE